MVVCDLDQYREGKTDETGQGGARGAGRTDLKRELDLKEGRWYSYAVRCPKTRP